MPDMLGAALLFIQACGYLGYRQTISEENLSSLFFEMDMSPTAIITGQNTDSRTDYIIRTISQQRKCVIMDLNAFPSMLSSHVSTVTLYQNLECVKQNLKFLVFADIETIRSLFLKVQQLDDNLGAGFLLRHFSRWLVVLTRGDVGAFITDNIVLDNVAVTTVDNIYSKNISLPQTLMWKTASRKLQSVSKTPTEGLPSRIFPNTKTGLNGRELKAAILPWFSCKLNNKTKSYSESCNNLMFHLSRVYNFSYTYVEPADQSWGKYYSGTWDGIMGLLVNKSVDISAVPYVASPLRSEYVTFLYPIRYSSKDILYKTTGSRVDWTVLLSCFKWQVYVCLSVVLMGVTTFSLMFKRASVRQSGQRSVDGYQTLEAIMSTIGVTCSQGSSTLPTTESNRILFAFWWLTCIPITSVYSGNLVAILTVSKDNVPFTGLDGLLDSGYDIGVETGSYIAEIFSGSNDTVNKQIWQRNREHQSDNLTIEEDRVYHRTRLAEGRYAFITDNDIIHSYMMETCDMAHTKNHMFQSASSLIVPKHSPLALLLDPELMALWERGIIDKWYKQTTRDENLCSSEEEEDNGLKLRDLFTVLVVAGFGVAIGAAVLVYEICKQKILSYMERTPSGKGL